MPYHCHVSTLLPLSPSSVCSLLLYLSLFGFTLEPRQYRSRFSPPKTFLQHINFSTLERQNLRSEIFSPPSSGGVATLTSLSATHDHHPNNLPSNTCNSSPTTNHVSTKTSNVNSSTTNLSHKTTTRGNSQKHSPKKTEKSQASFIARLALGNISGDHRYTWEYALMLPTTPGEVRNEVDILLSDLIVRLKQLLFNSLLCAYYVGFIPMLFADVSNCYYISVMDGA